MRASISKPTPFIYLTFEKKQTHSYIWSSTMLTYSYTALWVFFVPIYCWLLDKYHSQFIEYQENKQPRKISQRKICAYTRMSEKWGLSHWNPKKIGSFIYFLLKKGSQSYIWQRWKRGLFRTHIRTMPYIGSYPPPPSCVLIINCSKVIFYRVLIFLCW